MIPPRSWFRGQENGTPPANRVALLYDHQRILPPFHAHPYDAGGLDAPNGNGPVQGSILTPGSGGVAAGATPGDGFWWRLNKTLGQQYSIEDTAGYYDPRTYSVLWFVRFLVPTTSTTADGNYFMVIGSGSTAAGGGPLLRFNGTGKLKITLNGVTTAAGAFDYRDGLEHGILFGYNRGQTRCRVLADAATGNDTITGTWSTAVNSITRKGIGSSGAGLESPDLYVRDFAIWRGAAAELYDSQAALDALMEAA